MIAAVSAIHCRRAAVSCSRPPDLPLFVPAAVPLEPPVVPEISVTNKNKSDL